MHTSPPYCVPVDCFTSVWQALLRSGPDNRTHATATAKQLPSKSTADESGAAGEETQGCRAIKASEG